VRVTQNLSDMIRDHLLSYGVSYLNFDLDLPESGMYKFRFFPFYINFNFFNLRAEPVIIDLDTFRFDFTQMRKNKESVVYFTIPAIETWRVYLDYDFRFIFHFQGSLSIEFRDIELTFSSSFKATERG